MTRNKKISMKQGIGVFTLFVSIGMLKSIPKEITYASKTQVSLPYLSMLYRYTWISYVYLK